MNALAMMRSDEGRQLEAIRVMGGALQLQTRLLGRDNPFFRMRQVHLARFHFLMNDHDAGNEQFSRLLREAEAALGKDSSEVGSILVAWGTLLRDYDRRFERSSELLRRGLAILLKNEPESINCLRAYARLVEAACWTGRLDDAKSLIEEARKHAQRWYPMKPRESVALRAQRGYVRALEGNYDAAKEELQQALNGMRSLAGTDDPEYLQALLWLARVHIDTGDLQEAENLLVEILDMAGDQYAGARAHALRCTAAVRSQRGEPEAALELLTEARHIAEKEYGPDHRVVAELLAATVPVLRELNEVEQADQVQRQIEARNVRVARKPPR